MKMIKVGVIGSTGYAGSELVRLLEKHENVKIEIITSNSYSGQRYEDIFCNFKQATRFVCEKEDIEEMAESCDVIFIALPHGMASKKVTRKILEKTKIIDLGADFRLKDVDIYKKWYNEEHPSEELLPEAVYGLCEINREDIKKANLIANPGCYTTCSILPLYPLLKENVIDKNSIIIDAKSGVSGAGRETNQASLYCEANESIKAYKIASHRHTPEIEEQLSYAAKKNIVLSFTPHLVPMNRGILATSYATLKKDLSFEQIKDIYKKYYENEYFIRICNKNIFPETKWVKASNFLDIGFTIDKRTNRIVIVSALDNLVKGAAGQAVQNMNIIFGIDEKTGIDYIPAFPC